MTQTATSTTRQIANDSDDGLIFTSPEGAPLGAIPMNDLAILRTCTNNRHRVVRGARTVLNRPGRPHGNLQVRRSRFAVINAAVSLASLDRCSSLRSGLAWRPSAVARPGGNRFLHLARSNTDVLHVAEYLSCGDLSFPAATRVPDDLSQLAVYPDWDKIRV